MALAPPQIERKNVNGYMRNSGYGCVQIWKADWVCLNLTSAKFGEAGIQLERSKYSSSYILQLGDKGLSSTKRLKVANLKKKHS